MAQSDINVALHQAKVLFVRKTQSCILSTASLAILFWMAFYWYFGISEWALWALVHVPVILLVTSMLVFGLGGKFSLGFGLLSAVFLIISIPFSFLALIPLKQFQEDREYIDYERRVELLPVLKQSSVQNLNLEGRIPMLAWTGVIIGVFIFMAGLWRFNNLTVGILGLIIFGIGILIFNRTNISIRGEKIIITRTGIGGSLRRSNFSVVHRIEVTHIDYRHGKLKIRYAFVGTGIERDVVFFGSEKVCRRIVDALTTQSEENVYDLDSISLRESAEPFMPPADIDMAQVQTGSQSNVGNTGIRTLVSAIRSKQLGLINQLLQAGVNPNGVDQMGQTPLQVAQQTGNLQVVEMLQKAGATH